MSQIEDLRVVPFGWRVLVAATLAGGTEKVTTVPMVGWGRVAVMTGPDSATKVWLPCWWDDLGLTSGAPYEAVWPLAPGEDADEDLVEGLLREVREVREVREGRSRTDVEDS